MPSDNGTDAISYGERSIFAALADRYPNIAAARAEIAALRAGLSLPKPVVHVISDIHGDYKKLRHVLNNASGSLRPLVEGIFGARLTEEDLIQFLSILYYPRETMQRLRATLSTPAQQADWAIPTLRAQFEVIRRLAANYRRAHVVAAFPPDLRELFQDLLDEPNVARDGSYVDTIVREYAEFGSVFEMVRSASRVVRNLSIAEIFVAGDMGDRGLRIDRVVDYLMRQPNVSITWGNHDTSWMGACLGEETCIATVLRLSLRYGRLEQLEEGYGIPIEPLEHLARTVYGDDPAERFKSKGTGIRDELLMARMQKAAAILTFKLEGQTSRRHPEWGWEQRNLLHRINRAEGTVEIDGRTYPLLDTRFPTVDPGDPYALSPEERECMQRLQQSFVTSRLLWDQMHWIVNHGSMWQRRDDVLIFHACVPVDVQGGFLSLQVDGQPRRGRELFDALGSVIRRAFRKGADHRDADADWLWYMWTGPLSPLFGKDKMATFESYFVADRETHKETKNPYFELINDSEFCKTILREFGVTHSGLIVNGHVPVKIADGEQPVKRGGNAVTIDGAFSEAYGDHGYTLILDAARVALAEHSHFESIDEAITRGADIIPKVSTLRAYDPPRRVADTERGETIRSTIALLKRLVHAYQEGWIVER
jgi:fructose-1,6-bisphosphatase III